ncbi:MAG TPA: hypothetical protein DEP66_04715 [Acidimicrobiaceae bacterium]|nr:hypothetical protein [Acidimicrobiaceae bacterium]HCB37500.1 hypothetical protein [Acidimicrobiaceae bacterium]
MNQRELTVDNLNRCWDGCADLFGSLSEQQWQVRSHCPDWDVKGVAAHLLVAERTLSGWVPDSADAPLPFAGLGADFAAALEMPADELAAELASVLDDRRAQLADADDELFDAPSPTPVGKLTYGRFMAIREFDFWMHERDCRMPLGLPADNGGPAAEMALDEVHRSIGYIAGKQVGLPQGASMHFEITGACTRDIFVAVDGRAAEVESLADPTATLHCDSMAFMNLACGRVDPEEPIAAGLVSWSGDEELGAHAARHLRFTM